jgi:hypothetical protein
MEDHPKKDQHQQDEPNNMADRFGKNKFENALMSQLKARRSKNCFKWIERGIMFQLFCSVSLLFCFFSLVYSFYLFFAVAYFEGRLILSQREVIESEALIKFDTIFNGTMSLVSDYFNLTQ